MAEKKLADMSGDEKVANVRAILAWLRARAARGDEMAIRAIRQIPEVRARAAENRRLGRTPVLRGGSTDGGCDG